MNRKRIQIHRIPLGTLFVLGSGLFAQQTVHATVTLMGTANFNTMTNVYDYSYSVTNTEPLDVVIVSIPATSAAMIGALTAPTGFAITYDPSQGWINLNEDNDIFTDARFTTNSTIGPFTFSTPIAPATTMFQAFDSGGNEFGGTVVAPVPEASTALLTIPLGLLALRRRRTSNSADHS